METFAQVVRRHLGRIGWSQNELAVRLGLRALVGTRINDVKANPLIQGRGKEGVPKSQVSRWMNGEIPTEDNLLFLALVLFEGYRTSDLAPTYHAWDIVPLFNELLAATRRAPVDSGDENSIWRRLINHPRHHSDGELKVAWTPLSGYCPEENRGYSWELATTVAKMLNFGIKWVRYEQHRDRVFDVMIADLCAKKIDLIGPFLFQIPNRLREVRLTDSIGFREKLVGIVGADITAVSALSNAFPMCTRGDISEIISQVLFPHTTPETFNSESDLLTKLARLPHWEDGKPRCYVTGIFDANRILDDHKKLKQVNITPDDPSTNNYSFSFASSFAVARSEPRLTESIDLTIRILKKNGYIFNYLKNKYRERFRDELASRFTPDSIAWEDEDHPRWQG